MSKPLVSWLVFGTVIWLWRVPRFYAWALENSFAHALEHFTMLAAAALFWWSVVQPLGRRRQLQAGVGILYLLTTLIHTGLLGALLTFAPVPYYAANTDVITTTLSTLEDQQLAGLIMWMPMGLLLGAWAVMLLGQWLRQMEKRLPG